jgi:hypothetical protein
MKRIFQGIRIMDTSVRISRAVLILRLSCWRWMSSVEVHASIVEVSYIQYGMLPLEVLTETEIISCIRSTGEGKVDYNSDIREAHEGDHRVPQSSIPDQAFAQGIEEGQE